MQGTVHAELCSVGHQLNVVFVIAGVRKQHSLSLLSAPQSLTEGEAVCASSGHALASATDMTEGACMPASEHSTLQTQFMAYNNPMSSS